MLPRRPTAKKDCATVKQKICSFCIIGVSAKYSLHCLLLDDETAKIYFADLLLTYPHYYQLSGVDAEDKDLTNHLSYLILDAADEIDITCNLSVRVRENCDPNFLWLFYFYENFCVIKRLIYAGDFVIIPVEPH